MKLQHSYLVFAVLSFLTTPFLMAKNFEPFIHPTEGYIKMSSNFPLCGGVLIRPIIANIQADEGFKSAYLELRAVRFSDEYTPKEELGSMTLKPEGVRAAYRWGTITHPDSHYRIYCEKVNITPAGKEVAQPVQCQEYVTLDQIRHNRPCIIGPAGPGGSFAPLNMK